MRYTVTLDLEFYGELKEENRLRLKKDLYEGLKIFTGEKDSEGNFCDLAADLILITKEN